MKIPIDDTSDNVMYEALVGFFLNEPSLRYPSFLETYSLYNLAEVDCFKELIEINVKLTKINRAFDFLKQTFTDNDILYFLHELRKETPVKDSLEYYINLLKIGKLRNNNYNKNVNDIKKIKEELVTQKTDILLKILKCMKTGKFKTLFINSSQINEQMINDACKNPTNYAVLIQHLKDAKTLNSMLSNKKFVKNDLLYILFQVYMTLSSLSNVFTHYDLHTNNVLVYEPVVGSYIEYHYYIGSETIIFKSRYIAKIIDYGRCYFDPNIVSPKQGDPLQIKSTQKKFNEYTDCIDSESLVSFSKDFSKSHQMNSAKRNMSHDLRLINIIKTDYLSSTVWISQMPPIIFGQGMDEGYEEFGTEENTEVGYPTQINNVTDAFSYLKDTVKKEPQIESNNSHYILMKMEKLGDLHIYDDGKTNMNYVPVSELPTTVSEHVPV